MRMVLMVLSAWTGALLLAVGVFVALIRGGGGTDAAPLPVDGSAADLDVLPAQRAPEQAGVAPLEAAFPAQRTGVEHDPAVAPTADPV